MSTSFTLLRTITLGLHPDGAGYARALQSLCGRLDADVEKLLSHSDGTKWRTVRLVTAKVRDLGFIHGGVPDEIIAAAVRLRLTPPPLECGPDLRLQYLDQPRSHLVRIGMLPVAIDLSGFGAMWVVEHIDPGRLRLKVAFCAKTLFGPDYQFCFIQQ